MPPKNLHLKYIFVSGGVLSGLGKGTATASLGLLFKAAGYKTTIVKIDPYVSVDAGTMRPAEHGEVFVTDDGGEIDQDLGNYERFLNESLTKDHNITTGKVYQNVIAAERAFKFQGRDAEIFPDVINEIKRLILLPTKDFEIALVEIGGTVGDLENQPFLHAVRELSREYPSVQIMVTYLPLLKNTGELKTKPTQHAVARLREVGIFPDFIVTRNEIPLDQPRIESLVKHCFIDPEGIIDDPDTETIYNIPLRFRDEKFVEKIQKKLGLRVRSPKIKEWEKFVDKIKSSKKKVGVALVGKYVEHGSAVHNDVYISVLEAVRHAAAHHQIAAEVTALDSEKVEKDPAQLKHFQGIIVPQGWGSRGTEGKIAAANFARENKIPYLGLCFGLQMAIVEFGRNICNLDRANSEEVDPQTPYPVIHIMPDQKEYLKKNQYGGTIRLGAWPCQLLPGSKLSSLYEKYAPESILREGSTLLIRERHRHRYEFNNDYRKIYEDHGIIFSGLSPDGKLAEAVELPESLHPFFLATQFHPEFQSRPLRPHPIFLGFLHSCAKIS